MPDAPAATTTAPASTEATGTAPASTAPATSTSGFDWKAVGLDDAALNVINERQWKNPADLFTSYRNLEKLTGVPADRIVKIPGPKDDPKAWDEVFTKLGRPEAADKYVIPVPEGDKGEFAGVAKSWFHEAGVTQSQATKLAEKWNAFNAEQKKQQETAIQTKNTVEIKELKDAWGADFDAHSELVDRAAETFGVDQQTLDALKQVMGPKKAMNFFKEIGSKIAVEDSKVGGMEKTGPVNGAMSKEAARAKLNQLKRDKTFSQLFTSQDPKARQDARNEIARLTALAGGA